MAPEQPGTTRRGKIMGDYTEHLITQAGGDGEPKPLDLDAIQARADAATEGPWDCEPHGFPVDPSTPWSVYSLEMDDSGNLPSVTDESGELVTGQSDAEFIAAARTDVSTLLALVREQAAQIERVKALADEHDRAADNLLHRAEGYIDGEYKSRHLARADEERARAWAIRAALTATEAEA